MPKYNVEIEYDDEDIEVEACDEDEAQNKAIEQAECLPSKVTVTEIEEDD